MSVWVRSEGSLPMPKALTISGMVVALLIFVVFALDLALGIPFKKASSVMDIGFIICALALGYLSWSSWRDVK
jgi:hypothetical protein